MVTPQAPACTLSASPNSIQQGGSSTLTWTTSNATSVSIDNGIGGVATGGSYVVAPSQSTTYTLTATGPGGTVHCTAPITVTITPPPSCTLSASPSTVTNNGQTTLYWTTNNVTSFVIDQGVGSVSPVGSGSITVTPGGSRTYTGTATGPGGTVTCATTVSVNSYNPGPSCTMSVSPSTIDSGDSSTLRWDSDNVDHVRIDNGIGDVNENGSRSVHPRGEGTYTYRGTFYGDNGSVINCSATLRIREHVTPHVVLNSLPQVPDQPLSYVYLSELPYTGLDLGPVGTVLYWLMLILWCLAIAYLVLFNGLPFALRGVLGVPATVGSHNAYAHSAYVPQAPVRAPARQSAAPAPQAPARSYGSYEGFKSFAQKEVLTIEDIVKGLSREAEHALPAAPVVVAAPIVEHFVAEAEDMLPVAPVAKMSYAPAMDSHDVPGFIQTLLAGNKEAVFGAIRTISVSGGDSQEFLSHVVFALDDAYRARIDGSEVHADVKAVTANCSTSMLERLVTTLSTAVDSTYSTGTTGVKLAVTRALSAVNG